MVRRRKLHSPSAACIPLSGTVTWSAPKGRIAGFADEQDPERGRRIVSEQAPHRDLMTEVRHSYGWPTRSAARRCSTRSSASAAPRAVVWCQ